SKQRRQHGGKSSTRTASKQKQGPGADFARRKGIVFRCRRECWPRNEDREDAVHTQDRQLLGGLPDRERETGFDQRSAEQPSRARDHSRQGRSHNHSGNEKSARRRRAADNWRPADNAGRWGRGAKSSYSFRRERRRDLVRG